MFKQSGFILGEVKKVKKERKTAKSGKDYDQYSLTLVTANEGVGMIVRKNVYNLDEEKSDFIVNKIASYESMIERVANKEKIYGYIMIKPATSKEGKITMFDKISTYSTDEGKSGISVDAWVNEVPFEETDSGLVFKFKSSTKTVAESATSIEVDMLVTEKDGNRLSLIDNETTDFPVTMDVYLKDDVENLATLGQGYRFSLVVEKGKKVASTNEGEIGWDTEAKDTYAPDILRVIKVGKVNGYISDSIKSDDSDNSALF